MIAALVAVIALGSVLVAVVIAGLVLHLQWRLEDGRRRRHADRRGGLVDLRRVV